MTMKSLIERKEDLIQQLKKQQTTKDQIYEEGRQSGIRQSFESFSDLVNTFLKYQDNVKLLMSEEKHIWKKWIDYYEHQSNISKLDYINSYNIGLFNYLFCNTIVNEEMFTSIY